MQGFLYPELDRPSGSVQHPSAFPIHLMLLIPLMLCNGRFPCVPLIARIPVFFNSRLQVPLSFPNIHLTTLEKNLVDHTCQFLLGEGSFTLVSSEQRVGNDLKMTLKLYFSQGFLICSLTPLTYGVTANGCFSSSWDSSSSGSSSGSSGDVDGICMEVEVAHMNDKG